MSQSFGDTAFSPKGVIWVLSIFERIRLSRYCAAIRERNSFLYRICKKNIFCSKYMINSFNIFLSNGKKIFIPFSSVTVYKVLIEFSILLYYITVIRKINDFLLQNSRQ